MRMRPIALAIGACALSVLSVRAATLVVTSTADSGAGSLRDTIAAANAGDTIQFDAALKGQTIALTSAELLINKNLTIDGPGASQLTVKRSTAGGTPDFRIFEITPGHTVTINGITISNGSAHIGSPGDAGGGIYNEGSTLTIANSTISGNFADYGGGIFSDGVEAGSAQVTMSNSILSGNSATLSGAGIYSRGSGNLSFAAVTLNDCTINGNSAGYGAGVFNDGYAKGNAFLIINNSTFSGNLATYGGGIFNEGQFTANNALATLSNTTMSGNSAAAFGGAIENDGATVEIGNSTISDNSAQVGGGLHNLNGGGASTYSALGIGNTILKAGASGANIFNDLGTVTSRGYNVSSDNGGGFLTATGDQINTDPMLGPLQNNGGPTFTHELLTGSPAINAGDPSFTPPPLYDQRGFGYLRVFNGRIDIGSLEVQPAFTPSPTPTATATATASPTPTPTATATSTPTATATATATTTPTATATSTSTATATATTTATTTPTATSTPTATATATATPIATPTPTPTVTPTASTSLLNISTRLRVLTGDNALIGGFIVTGNASKRVIVRAIGPSLANFGVPGALADPTLELHGSGSFITITNDNWRDTQQAEIEATGIAPSNDLESAIVATLPPGAYTAVVRGNDGGTGVGLVEAYDLNSAADAQLANISTRGFVDTGDNVMIGGFILGTGSANARVLIRAIGPSLTAFGVPNALADPTLELHNNNGDIIAANDNWRDTQQAEIEATGIPPSDDRESAIIQPLSPDAYTAIVRGKNNTTGVALVEAYKLGDPSTPTPSPTPTPTATATSTPVVTPTPTPSVTPSPTPGIAKFSLLTSREMVGTGAAIMLNAFIITGPDPRRVIVRGLGPSLVLPTPLADPVIELRASDGTLIAINDNWRDTQEAEIIATGLAPANDLESAIVATLSPGSYTVVLRGRNNTTGNGVTDLHDLSSSSASGLTAIGTRAYVLSGNDALTTGIVVQQAGDVLLRVLGGSLSKAGLPNVLADPTVELRDGNGVLLVANDNWQDDPAQAAQIMATGIPPTNNLEAAIVASLPPGSYTAIGRGKNNTTGIGYVQFYSLPHSGPVLNLTP